jgi:hypothetical protein
MGMRTVLKLAPAIFWKSPSPVQVLQWVCRICSAFGACWQSVYSSTMEVPGNCWNIEGVIHGSSISHPPMLTPRTGCEPKLVALRQNGVLAEM